MSSGMEWVNVAITDYLRVRVSPFLNGFLVEIPENSFGEGTTYPPVVFITGYRLEPHETFKNMYYLIAKEGDE